MKAIALPGAIGQIAIATLLGMGLAWAMGWPLGAGLVFGLALSVASTVVLLRALQERRLVETERGRIAVGWLIVEDLAMVLALVLLPALAGLLGGSRRRRGTSALDATCTPIDLGRLAITLAKVAAFVAVMLVVGRRVIPWVLHYVAHTGSRELFRLAVLGDRARRRLRLGRALRRLLRARRLLRRHGAGRIASSATGRAGDAAAARRLRGAVLRLGRHAVRPGDPVREPLAVLATRADHRRRQVAGGAADRPRLPPSAGDGADHLRQPGADRRVLLHPRRARRRARPAAGGGQRPRSSPARILSILLNPLLFVALDRLAPRIAALDGEAPGGDDAITDAATGKAPLEGGLAGHAVLIGFGRVGSLVGEDLIKAGVPFLVIEENDDLVDTLKARGIRVITGNAAQAGLLDAADVKTARFLISAIPNPFESGALVEQARAANPALRIIARAHSDEEVAYLRRLGADLIVMGEAEIARAICDEVDGRAKAGREEAADAH